jgi:ATPase subunit of ABC transporter with duplicated ATPase domains
MNITANLNQACHLLSGGQLALLQLHSLFCSDASILLLDEPSNHLDLKGKQWLIEKINNFEGKVLLVSHDRFLLENVDAIYQLTGLGLNYFEGNYSQFMEQSQRIEQALDRRIDALKLEKRKIERQEQINKERMEQRASQGNKMRKNGSQPKILLDAMKNSAEQSQASSVKNKNNQKARNSEKLVTLSRQKEALKSQAIYMPDGDASKRTVLLTIDNAHLSFGCKQSIWLKLTQGERLHLQGGNGSGKSTLLKAIHDQPLHQKGPIVKRSESVYLDQHFGLLNSGMNLLDSLRTSCAGLVESEARTLLAGIGFRRDTVYRQIACLSGGEKMKLAMLMVSHKKEAPILLLDEPDNHLDIESKERLSQALKHYKGAFILVSHDDYFVQSLGVNNTLSLCS